MGVFKFRKNIKFHNWLLKWHFVSGIIMLPFVLLLAITGFIYLFKDTYENPHQTKMQQVKVENKRLSYDELWEIANKAAANKPHSIIINNDEEKAVEFISGKFGKTSHLYINPYNGNINGQIIDDETLMNNVRKLHGELLLGSWGTKIVELVGSWLVVMLISGIYLWWPVRKWKLKGNFLPRLNQGISVLFRDFHAVSGFWIAIILLMILAGGLPWTDVFGENFKKIQSITNTGYPETWDGKGIHSIVQENHLSIDKMVQIVKEKYPLPGIVSLKIPEDATGIYSLSNTYPKNLNTQKAIHFDRYSGNVILKHDWADVGILMRARMWFMAFHQGQLGKWNFLLIAGTACVLVVMCISAIGMYFKRRNKFKIKIDASYKPKPFIVFLITVLGVILPLFGLSILIILALEKIKISKLYTILSKIE